MKEKEMGRMNGVREEEKAGGGKWRDGKEKTERNCK